jgi:hypothetical protein
VTNSSTGPEHLHGLAGVPFDHTTRQRVLALIHEELVRTSAEALACGAPTDHLAEYVEERVIELRRQTNDTDVQP